MLPETQKMPFHGAYQAPQHSRKGIWYKVVDSCLLLGIFGLKAYKLISRTNLLQLPSLNRRREILKGMHCESGFSKIALKNIAMQFQDENGYKCYGTFIVDEMKVQKAV